VEPSSVRAVNAFFDDIRYEYGEALKILATESGRVGQNGPKLLAVGVALPSSSAHFTRASKAVLKSILHNAKAYDVVATSKSVTFNLEVYSVPDGATISYRQRGGEYHSVDHVTDWRIENLIRAVYYIRLQKLGFEDNEVTFDAVDSTSTSIKVPLVRKRGAR
jgi:hypothetical protein